MKTDTEGHFFFVVMKQHTKKYTLNISLVLVMT